MVMVVSWVLIPWQHNLQCHLRTNKQLKITHSKVFCIVRVKKTKYPVTSKKLAESSGRNTKYAVSTSIYIELIEDVSEKEKNQFRSCVRVEVDVLGCPT